MTTEATTIATNKNIESAFVYVFFRDPEGTEKRNFYQCFGSGTLVLDGEGGGTGVCDENELKLVDRLGGIDHWKSNKTGCPSIGEFNEILHGICDELIAWRKNDEPPFPRSGQLTGEFENASVYVFFRSPDTGRHNYYQFFGRGTMVLSPWGSGKAGEGTEGENELKLGGAHWKSDKKIGCPSRDDLIEILQGICYEMTSGRLKRAYRSAS